MNKYLLLTIFLLLHLAAIFTFFPDRIIASTSKGHWEAITLIFMLEIVFIWFYMNGLSKFPGETIVDICLRTIGRWGACVLLLPLVVFLMGQMVLLIYYQTSQIRAVLLQSTPTAATTFLFLVLCFYGAWKGLAALIHASIGLFVLFIPFILFSMLIGIKNFNFNYIFPVWDGTFSFLHHADFYICFTILSSFLFLGMIPQKERPVRFGRLAVGLGVVYVFGMGSVYIPLLVFGQESAVLLQYPMLMASDTIDLEWVVFDWLPSFSVVSSSGLAVLMASVLLWMSSSLLHQLLVPKLNIKWMVSMLSLLVYILCLFIPNIEVMNRYLQLNAFVSLFCVIGLPMMIFILGRWRGKKVST
ncbi:GerAB/ArcD/ProY family transporter [Paenibacillus paeoniae]|uniref:Uncharacterized protein n=1 Tax=Paenibacillus paeoniae TaxID=2292705 RepID=A0A371PKZ6_9BACL|nr:GerAB/ArcD/ProY family transporter [Paenibacillus paeoniae]REK76858.1 hypothetical protein DX130_07495 [Paenibacillus paeoniae]